MKYFKKQNYLFILIIFIVLIAGIANAQTEGFQLIGGNSLNAQYYLPSSFGAEYTSPSVYWPAFDKNVCRERQDFIVQIAPGGCEPAVVRSDLLEEQNVPVFCKLMVIQANPLIDVSRVKSITFPGKRPEGVAGITYFPSRYNIIGTRRDLVDTPVDDNAGYFVVSLKRQPSEDKMPDWIGGNLTAVIDYDIESALGIGKTYIYSSELGDEDWLRDYEEYSFWNGKGYIKTESIEEDRVSVSVYRDFNSREGAVTLKKGETSSPIYLRGFYCAAGLRIRLEDIQVPVETALLQIDDNQVWIAEGDRIMDEKCRVERIDAGSVGGKVSISCPVTDGRFDLKLSPGKISLNINGSEKEYNIGQKIDAFENVFLGYAGVAQGGDKKVKFAVLVNDVSSSTEAEFSDKDVYSVVDDLMEKNPSATFDNIIAAIVAQYSKKGVKNFDKKNILIINEGDSRNLGNKEIKFVNATLIENKIWGETDQDILLKEYYDKTIKNYRDLADFYPNEKKIDNDYFEEYAAEGLYRAAVLAQEFSMFKDSQEFLSKLRIEYPDSEWTKKAESEIKKLLKYDSSESRVIVYLREKSYTVQLLDLKKPSKGDISVDLLIGGKSVNLGLGEINATVKGSVQVVKIERDYVELMYTKSTSTDNIAGSSVRLDLNKNQQKDFDGTIVKLLNINLKKQVKMSLDSDVRGPRAFANFSFKIGIEKRGIKLSPEKTKEMIENLEESIGKWKDVNEKLGKVVKGMKGACFATSAVLMAKNLFEGFGGKSMARSKVMPTWNSYCERIVSSGELSKFTNQAYSSPEFCLLGHNDNIEKDVEIRAKYLQEVNTKLEQARTGLVETTNILDLEGQVTDREAMEKKFRELISSDCKSWANLKLPPNFCSEGDFEELKEIYLRQKMLQDSGISNSMFSDVLKNESVKLASEATNNYNEQQTRDKAKTEASSLGMKVTYLEGDNIILADIHKAKVGDPFVGGSKVTPATYLVAIPAPDSVASLAGNIVLIEVKESSSGLYTYSPQSKIYDSTGKEITDLKDNEAVRQYIINKKATKFKQSSNKAYENKMLSPRKLQVKYFDKAPYKGLPSEVPFDIENGWYVKLEYVLSGFGKPYDESGRAINYYICNVGENGLIEFKVKADDICRYYNGVNDDLGFPGLDASKSRELVGKAKNALYEASKFYGKKEATIYGQPFETGTSFGGEAGRCSDFMSPSDCHIMFNLCDPVICPSSRCDLGGAFPVDNVIQTGIIGSLVLCLPNVKEGIYIPVCLSGVHAGIEGYLSILESHKKCLNESLATGRTIGICDEIRSIYMCEFFWKQMVPFADVIVPKLIESFFSQGTRGGGEYLTVQSAWDNTQSSIDYFKNEYAVNSMTAFNMRSTEEAGTEVCKAFVSTRYPTDFDLLTEPDSPVQYHAWFDENALTTATPYPTSHYKVYYHIYSGKDQGAYYIIYLKEIPEELASSYIFTSQTYVVERGYLARGETIDQARDFTAPSGYKKLCVNINGQDECDFGKVSTSFAVDYLSDAYASEQAEQKITKSSECVAGTPSIYSLAQPNIQAGAEELVEPELYNQGIIRVCSTYNPGKQVNAKGEYDTTNTTFDRWKDVGYCDDKTLRCWLDTTSVKDVIKNKELEKEVLTQVDTSLVDKNYLTYEESREIVKSAEDFIRILNVKDETIKEKIEAAIVTQVQKLEKLSSLGPSSSYKANGLFLLGKLYGTVAHQLNPVKKAGSENAGSAGGTPAPAAATTTPPVSSTAGSSIKCSVKFYKGNEDITGKTVSFDTSIHAISLNDCEEYTLYLYFIYDETNEKKGVATLYEDGKYIIDLDSSPSTGAISVEFGLGEFVAEIYKDQEKIDSKSFRLTQSAEGESYGVIVRKTS